MGYKKGFPDPSNRQAEAKRNKRKRNEPRTLSEIEEQLSEEQALKNVNVVASNDTIGAPNNQPSTA